MMNELCSNCGAELFEGQQFCRRCGAPVRAASRGGEAPTQLFPQAAQSAQGAAAVGTSPVRGETGSVGVQQPTAYYPPANFQQTSPLVGQPFGSQPLAIEPPVRRRRRGVWIAALLAFFVFGAALASAGAFLWWRATHRTMIVKKISNGANGVPEVPVVPPVPADLGDRIKEALKGVPLPLDESGATVSGTDTVLTETYDLDADSVLAVHAVNGSITVKGVDGDQTVVKITKHGGSPQERSTSPVLASKTDEGLTLLTAPALNGAVSVSYEISLPRNLHKLELSADRGDVKVNDFDGAVSLNLTNGNISVAASGAVRSRLVNGKTSVSYTGQHEEAQEFSVVNGDVEVSFGGEPEADVHAASTNGDVKVDDSFGVKAEKRVAGHKLDTQFGGGGAPLTLKVVNGDIKLQK
ncbi:MAG: hypothetical protein QOE46_813 [Acidobacteriota bacterium]|jgi:hypothetical protein|nr:hypothetical protein [Acidobacteriota bacterium]